ncbi:hypothetical protein [Natrinema halophilum]|nr:hypothetical protein [Natrinema halophilum]UHQ95980.1 hypothetical protein HYG82_21120 [Natrinema halophilum]
MASSGYPPPESELSALVVVGGVLTIIGIAGIIWPEKLHSGSSVEGD